jgi:hypothetical protein
MQIVHRLYEHLPLNMSVVELNPPRSIYVRHDVRIGTGNQLSSKFFVAVASLPPLVDCTLITGDRPQRMQFVNTIDMNTLRMSSFYTVSVERRSLF